QLIPVLYAIEHSPLTGTRASISLLTREFEIARAAKAPTSVLANLEAYRATTGINDDAVLLTRLKAIADNPIYRQDSEASAFLNLLLGQLLSRGGRPADELLQLADTTTLPKLNPIRRAANLLLAEDDFS